MKDLETHKTQSPQNPGQLIERLEPLEDGGLVDLRLRVSAWGDEEDEPRPVLDWRMTGLMP
jgi:hypothetical protein